MASIHYCGVIVCGFTIMYKKRNPDNDSTSLCLDITHRSISYRKTQLIKGARYLFLSLNANYVHKVSWQNAAHYIQSNLPGGMFLWMFYQSDTLSRPSQAAQMTPVFDCVH